MSQQRTAGIAALAAIPLALGAGVVAFVTLLAPTPTDDTVTCSASVATVGDAALPTSVGRFDAVQVRNAAVIASRASAKGMPPAAALVGITTAITESGLRNLANRGEFQRPATSRVMTAAEWDTWRQVAMLSLNYPNDGTAAGDWDSVGLFQGRPQAGWAGEGTPEEMVQRLLDPAYTSDRFLDALSAVDGWETMPVWKAAQTVQRSAFPLAYAKHVEDAQLLLNAVAGTTVNLEGCTGDVVVGAYPGLVSDSGWAQPVVGSRYTGGWGDIREGYVHKGSDFAAPQGTPLYAAADGVVTHTSCEKYHGRSPCNLVIDHGLDSAGKRVTTLYVHMFEGQTVVTVGQTVTAGQQVAAVGNNGNSTGPHLHFEIWEDDNPTSALPYLRAHGVEMP